MAYASTYTTSIFSAAQPVLKGFARAGRSIVTFLNNAANYRSIASEVEKLIAKSDEDLALEGTTRSEEVTRIFTTYS